MTVDALATFRRQDISSHDIDYIEYVGPGLTWGRIVSTCVISMWCNDIKCKYMFYVPSEKFSTKTRYGVSNNWPFYCFFWDNSLIRLMSRKTRMSASSMLCNGKPPVTDGFPVQRDRNVESVYMQCSGTAVSFPVAAISMAHINPRPGSHYDLDGNNMLWTENIQWFIAI